MRRMNFSHNNVLLCCLMVALFFVVGCKKNTNPDGRMDVSGKIMMNGAPIRGSATIRFDAVGNSKLDGGSGRIDANGNYLLTGQDAVKPGKYIVRITSVDTFDKETDTWRTAETPEGREYAVRVVPREFNDESKIEFEVVAEKKNVFKYEFTTDKQPERIK